MLDQALSDADPVICGKKLCWLLVVNTLNIAFDYSWQLYHIVSLDTTMQKNIRRHVVSIMISRQESHFTEADSCPAPPHELLDEVWTLDIIWSAQLLSNP